MKTKTIGTLSGVALVAVLGLANPASAALIWDWSYSGDGVLGGIGTFTTTDERADGSFLITDITGTSENQTIAALLPPGSFPFVTPNDNLLFATFPQLTSQGFSYATGSESFNIFFNPSLTYSIFSSDRFASIDFAAIARITSPVTTPEPGSLLGCITLGSIILGSALKKARQ